MKYRWNNAITKTITEKRDLIREKLNQAPPEVAQIVTILSELHPEVPVDVIKNGAEKIHDGLNETGADIDRLVEIKRRHPNVILYVDEAHAFGVEGERGLGMCRSAQGYADIDIVAGTFGKACASMGAFCAVSRELHDYLVNRARSFIFSTALPPLTVAWTRFMIEKFLPMDAEREHLRALGRQLTNILATLSPDFDITPSHIQPFVTGDPVKAVTLSRQLLERGFKVLPIRVPTVPPGTDRLRISLNAAMTADDISRFGEALNSIVK